MPVTDELMTVEEAAIFLRLTPYTIRKQARAGRLPAFRAPGGNKILFKRQDILNALEPIVPEADNISPALLQGIEAIDKQINMSPEEEYADTVAGIKRGLESMAAGRGRPWSKIAQEMQSKYGIGE